MPEIKICGLTRAADVALCLDLEVDYTGFIFVPTSPRYIAPHKVAQMPEGKAKRVGVFAGQSVEQVTAIMQIARLDLAQLHGSEDIAFCREVGAHRVVKALWPEAYTGHKDLLADIRRFSNAGCRFLLDAGIKSGGLGRPFAWSRIAHLPASPPWWLAGGIGPHNLRQAMRCQASCLDVNSGVESAPGVKDSALLRATVWQVKNKPL